MIVLVFIISLAITGIAVSSLSNRNFQLARDSKSNETLKVAKDALIGYALAYAPGGVDNPGRFPCTEDITKIGLMTEGESTGNCSTGNVVIGRLPWKTLGSGQLRDANGDNLWYAISRDFNNSAVVINSDSLPPLGINALAGTAIGMVFSPGLPLAGQSRPVPSSSSPPNLSNYLEGENSDGDQDFSQGTVTPSFNDQFIIIRPDDIFRLMEKRVLREIKNYLVLYKSIWGAFPFPTPFSDPSITSYIGDIGATGGLLPIGDAGISWNSISSSCQSVKTSDGSVVVGTVSTIAPVLTCSISGQNYTGSRTVTFKADLNKIGLGFYQQMDTSSSSDFSFSPAAIKTSSNLTYSLNSLGGGTITLVANPTINNATYTIKFLALPDLDNWVTTSQIANYIAKNNWQSLIYYKVASEFLPGGSSACGPCLTVNKTITSPPQTVVQNNIHALLMSAGRQLITTELRPAPTYSVSSPAQVTRDSQLFNYFDSANNASGGITYDSKQLPVANFNDQVEIIE